MSEEEVNAGPARGGRRAQAQSAHARRDARPLAHDLARAAAPADRQRDHLRRPPRPAPLPAPAARTELRNELAERHGVDAERLILGNGAAELLSAATRALIAPGQELLTPLALLPALSADGPPRPRPAVPRQRRRRRAARGRRAGARRARGRAREPQRPDRRADSPRRAASACSTGCPTASRCCSTRRSSSSPTPSPRAPRWRCSSEHPRLLVFRSFSKAWGLAGLRIGYAIGGPGSGELLAELEPDLGVSEVSQAGALEALRSCSELIDERVQHDLRGAPARDRGAARARLRGRATARRTSCGRRTPASTAPSSPRAWRAAGVLVAAGDALGEPRHVRIGLRSRGPRTACSTRSTKSL